MCSMTGKLSGIGLLSHNHYYYYYYYYYHSLNGSSDNVNGDLQFLSE